MFARLSGTSVVIVAMLTACSGVEQDTASPRAAGDAAVAADAAAWPCDAPQSGHPTPAEEAAFVEEVGTLAMEAEERHGVPAAAITAMAILESGYGWTRLAQNTNNLLGWKHFPGIPAGDRDIWVLDCPERGTTDRFLVFRDRAEGVDYVADQLASTDNYRADSERYRRDRASGVDVVEAVDRWVDGIADPYSSDPDAYRAALKRVLNETRELGEGRQAERLYRLSEAVSPPPVQAAQATAG